MDLLPKCLQELNYPGKCALFSCDHNLYLTCPFFDIDFWNDNVDPTLRKFLNFRLNTGDLKDPDTEHYRYQSELNTLSKYYTKESEIGKKVLKLQRDQGNHIILFS